MDEKAEKTGSVGRARDGRPLIPQPHGGALAPYPPRVSMGGFKKARREALALLHEGTAEASARLLDMVRSDDERVAVIASVQVLDRTLGKPSDMPQGDDGSGGALDMSRLTAADREALMHHLAEIKRIRAKAAGAIQVVDGQILEG
jgi:hypothetical protein